MAELTVADIIAGTDPDFNADDDDFRQVRLKMKPLHGRPLKTDTRMTPQNLGTRPAPRVWVPAADDSPFTALFFHGGGFVSCPAEDYLFYAETISEKLGVQVLVPDYRLAPEHPHPAALRDCLASWQALLETGVDPAAVCFVGDSCGGALLMATATAALKQGLPVPGCLLGLTPWVDLDPVPGPDAGLPANQRSDPFISPVWLRNRAKDYLGAHDLRDGEIAPLHLNCEGWPPLLLQHGEIDITRKAAEQLAERVRAAGVAVTLDISKGMIHGFHGLAGMLDASDSAWARARHFVRSHLTAA